ncbi:MAG: hypothetical protein BWX87_00641 [Bacteroidetes bacterium ADurb.Bin123]|jgi:hypothetical protein|nr:MAG: hypothetical protein BWX87_00641 [Bacteroidetes bacterium ADurb.Bin123]
MKTIKKIASLLRKKNEFTFIIALIVVIWFAGPRLFRLFDPQAGEFSIEILYVPFIAGIYFFVALLFVWAYIALVWPKGYQMLDMVFDKTEKLETWEKLQVLLRLFACLIALFAVSLLAVTGISAIM